LKLPGQDSNLDKENQNTFLPQRNALPSATSDESTGRLDRALTKPLESDPDLARVVEAWPTLPDPIRRAMLALAAASATDAPKTR
jgi:hypothetical protein